LICSFVIDSPKMCFPALTASRLREILCHEDISRKSHDTSMVM
jgi:hypothetical protein